MGFKQELRITIDSLRARQRSRPPVILSFGPTDGAGRVFVVGTYRLAEGRPDAAKTIRLGFARAFAGLGRPTYVVDDRGLETFVRGEGLGTEDVVIASATDLMYFERELVVRLREPRLLVWVNPWFPRQREFFRRHGYPNMGTERGQARAVERCSPKAVFTTYPQYSFDYYENWITEYGSLLSVPHAFDHHYYDATSERHQPELASSLVYVGGYWDYKGRSLRKYLMPFKDSLVVFGYSSWPFGNYKGRLPEEQEADVLRSAAAVPAVNEPHAELLGGEVCERVFKIAGLGGLGVADLCPGFRELFSDDELLMPRTYGEYLETVRGILVGDLDLASYRRAGRAAVFGRHLYEHRARQMLEACGSPAESVEPVLPG